MSTPSNLEKQFALARRELLELSSANRLLNTKRNTTIGAAIEIKDESSSEIYKMLVTDEKTMRFEEGELVEMTAEEKEQAEVSKNKPTDEDSEEPKPRKRRTTKKRVATGSQPVDIKDDVLHTEMDPDELDRRLNRLVTDSSAIMQEQGINVLYLALGFLRWIEPAHPDKPRHAPLLLIPVKLDRGRGGSRYSLSFIDDEITTNITLKIRMLVDFGITLPDIPEATEEISPAAYFDEVAKAVSGQKEWEVLRDDVVLWFFSFSKLLMFRDLDPENWPDDKQLNERPLVKSLLQDGFPPAVPLIDNESGIDGLFDPAQTMHVIDCDSSQALVIEEATRGRSLVIQGPPGTGKSQTITNLIAASVAAGRSILFVAEKMAALEVVKRRLDNIGLGDMVLELHSTKTNKKAILQELDQTLKQGVPQIPPNARNVIGFLKQRRDQLNAYVDVMHRPFQASANTPAKDGKATQEKELATPKADDAKAAQPSLQPDLPEGVSNVGPTPYQILTELIDLRAQNTPLPDFQIPDAAQWTFPDYQKKLTAVSDLASVLHEIGDAELHPWRGSQMDVILPLDLERVLVSAPQRVSELTEAVAAGEKLASRFSVEAPQSLRQVQQLINTVEAFTQAPQVDPVPMNGTVWSDHRESIKALADNARQILQAKEKVGGLVKDNAWDQEVEVDYEAYAKHGQKFLRMLYPSYRKARNTLRSSLIASQPATFEERLRVLEMLKNRRSGLKKLMESSTLGEKAFGRFWMGAQSDWKKISDWEKWDAAAVEKGVHPRFRSLFSLFDKPEDFQTLAKDSKSKLASFEKSFKELSDSLKIDLNVAYDKWADKSNPNSSASNQSTLGNGALAPHSEIRSRLESWISKPEGLQQWQTYRRAKADAEPIGKGALVERLAKGAVKPEHAANVFRFAHAESVLREIYKLHPELETFDGTKFEKIIDEFCEYDISRIELARAEIAKYHWDGIGRQRVDNRGDNLGEQVALLRHEMQKQRRHLPLRQLLQRAGNVIQSVKPVFMMSPISVAQYLEPGELEFDMLLIDEASQVRPVEALGAAARCRQMIVVGDDKQMPPTQFFGRVVGEIDEEDQPEMQAGDVESILGLAIARNMPQRMLRWHYRSKHESLIAVSNREFYDNQLYVVPSPERKGELGVKLTFIDNGRFLKGRNEIEAERVAQAIMQHAKEKPKWSLGVAAFSVVQRDAILNQLEKLRKADSSCEAFFDTNAPDPFFIKNLENVQGDERDAIFVSVGYGPGEDGKVALNFGPVSSAGGERRLNVLMTRAKQVLHIFTSMRAEDIDLQRATGRGPAVFREYLRYAQEREAQKVDTAGAPQSRASRDRLAEVLKRELEQRGHNVAISVGIAGLYVDVAVLDPNNLGRCLVGICLDGETFRSARSARDRNRTYDGVLGGQGWVIHHIWSPEWFRKPQEQLTKLLEVIEAAKRGTATRKQSRLASAVSKIERKTGGLDPLAQALGTAEPVPPKASQERESSKQSSQMWGAVLSGAVKAGAAILTAEKGKGLEAAIDALTKDEEKKTKKRKN